ncbi:hypothetical protein MA16_Dca016300 [Dendrobium catenatum]|uniref:Uncharacterized protein n=1 Tax=Dendrobium catenatum TaxID=906689 RepID=A0A2I0W856_9ASPA|nr:hypothetical protein MA16_Dca016300 [Dendrobium catenatum]
MAIYAPVTDTIHYPTQLPRPDPTISDDESSASYQICNPDSASSHNQSQDLKPFQRDFGPDTTSVTSCNLDQMDIGRVSAARQQEELRVKQ